MSHQQTSDKRKASDPGSTAETRQKKQKNICQIKVNNIGFAASLTTDDSKRVPLYFQDIMRFITVCQYGKLSPVSNRWCFNSVPNRKRNVLLIMEANFDMNDLKKVASFDCLHYSEQIVSARKSSLEMIREISLLALFTTEINAVIEKYKTIKSAVRQVQDVLTPLSFAFPIDSDVINRKDDAKNNDSFDRTTLLMSLEEFGFTRCPLPNDNLPGFKLTKNEYKKPTEKSPLFAVDCEMVTTVINKPELAEVAVVDENFETVYQTLVKPRNKVINYATKFSGITKQKLDNVNTRIEDVQEKLTQLLPSDSILVGHAINNDLHALKILHPFLIDSSIVYNQSGDLRKKTSLKSYTAQVLHEEIQKSSKGHSAAEDATASLKLILHKLKHDYAYGNVLYEDSTLESSANFKKFVQEKGTCTIYGSTDIMCEYQKHISEILGKPAVDEMTEARAVTELCKRLIFSSEESNDRLIETMSSEVNCNDLTIAHMRLDCNLEHSVYMGMIETWIKRIYEVITEDTIFVTVLSDMKDNESSRAAYFCEK